MRRRQIRAIFFDIDGTLRDFDTKRVPDSTKEALRKAKEAGILLFVATGRHKLEIEEENLLEDMEFDGYVTLNGQYCYCGSTVVYDVPIDGAGVAAMLRLIGKDPFPCLFMEADRMYINMVDEVVKKAQEGIGTRIPPVMDVSRAAGQPGSRSTRSSLISAETGKKRSGARFPDVRSSGGTMSTLWM